jgi:hypothetical protein
LSSSEALKYSPRYIQYFALVEYFPEGFRNTRLETGGIITAMAFLQARSQWIPIEDFWAAQHGCSVSQTGSGYLGTDIQPRSLVGVTGDKIMPKAP